MKIYPYFTVNGKKYEIRPTRYLMAEYDKMRESADVSAEDKENVSRLYVLLNDTKKYAEKVEELENRFFETLDDEDERKYLKMKVLYEKTRDEAIKLEAQTNSRNTIEKKSVDMLEQIVLLALQEQHNLNAEEANKVWTSHVNKIGNNKTVEWLSYMSDCLFNAEDDEDDDFLSQMRKKAEERALNRKNAIRK